MTQESDALKSRDRLVHQHQVPSRTMSDVLSLPDTERSLMNWLVRQQSVTLEDAVLHFGLDHDSIRQILNVLIEQGFVEWVSQEGRYFPSLKSRKSRRVPSQIFDALSDG